MRVTVRFPHTWPTLIATAILTTAVVGPTWAEQSAGPSSTAPATVERPALLSEPRLIGKAMSWIEDFGDDALTTSRDGFYPEFKQMITGAGWISAGPGYRRTLFGGTARINMSAAVSSRLYKTAQARIEFPRVAKERVLVGAQGLWRDFTQIRYFGDGAASLKVNETDYRLQTTNVVSYVTWQPRTALAVTGTAGMLSRLSISSSTGPFDRAMPDTATVFVDEPGAGLARQPRYLHGEISVTADTRDHPGYALRGGLYRAAWSIYRNRPAGTFNFDRFEAEAAQFVPVAGNRGVLAFRTWAVFSHTIGDNEVPFYFLPSVGGHNTLRGYANYRFHGRHFMIVNLESRWALFEHVDAAVFVDAGNVAARLDDLNLERRSYGFGLRVHTENTTVGRLDIAHSDEGWRFVFKFNDPFRLARLAKRIAPLPFAP